MTRKHRRNWNKDGLAQYSRRLNVEIFHKKDRGRYEDNQGSCYCRVFESRRSSFAGTFVVLVARCAGNDRGDRVAMQDDICQSKVDIHRAGRAGPRCSTV